MGENLNIFGTFLPGGAKGKCFNFREVTLHLCLKLMGGVEPRVDFCHIGPHSK